MPVAAGPSPTQAQLQTLVRGFLLNILSTGWEVILGQSNRVPEPTGDNFVCVIPTKLKRLATQQATWSSTPDQTLLQHQQDVESTVELQFFGEDAFDGVNVTTTLLRSGFGVAFFANSGVAPLHCDDGQQVPFINGEHQYEDRWILDAVFELSVAISTTQQFADTVALTYEPPVDAIPVE